MNKIKSFYRKYLHNFLGVCGATAILINLIIETLARQTIYGGVVFLVQSPLVFLFNTLIIFACISIAMLFRHKVFAFCIISATWLGLGITNGVILRSRMTPLTTYDMLELKDGLSLATNYFSKSQIIGMIVGLVVVLLVIIILFRKAPKEKEKVNYKRALATLLLIGILTAGYGGLMIKTKVVDTYFPNLAYGYRDNGFVYCFLATWLDKGVSKPFGYSQEFIENIFTEEEREKTVPGRTGEEPKKHPNIIFLQLESFIDPQIAKDITLSKDAMPNYHRLAAEFSSGKLQVPSVGAGTANTEFETMTGMSVKFFGPGEYPYKSVLLEENCESIPFNLRQLGYSTHAIHNHRGVFYERNRVFGNLGFETFTSLEYMNNVGTTPKNWAKDYVLTDQILDALNSTENQDYIYTISVQGHGKYPTQEVIENPEVEVTKAPSEASTWAWEYYANQVYEMDKFVGEFTTAMKEYGEDVVVVMYGDHLPAMDNLTEDNLIEGRNTYQTDYIIWNNFGMEKQDQDLYAYQIGAELLDRLDIHNGTFVTYHQNHKDSSSYLPDLRALQYDVLYGKRYIYGGETPFVSPKLKMGVKEIKINEVIQIGDRYYLKGENFTEYSKVNLDGEILDTVYLGPTILGLKEDVSPEDVSRMKVSQVERKNEILSTSE